MNILKSNWHVYSNFLFKKLKKAIAEESEGQFIVPDRGDEVDLGIGHR